MRQGRDVVGMRRLLAAAAVCVSAMVVEVPSAVADDTVTPSERLCFAAEGAPGQTALINLTPVGATGRGNGLLVSSDVAVAPVASNVNFDVGTVDPNVAIAPIGADGAVCFVNSADASTELIADHMGSFTALTPATASGAPIRAVDTRKGLGGSRLVPGARVCFSGGGPAGDVAVVNLTPVGADGRGSGLLVSSDVSNPPLASNVNYDAGTVDPNVAIAPIGADGSVCFVNSTEASIELIADVLGTIRGAAYAPADPTGAPVRVVDTRQDGNRLSSGQAVCFEVAGNVGDVAVVNLTPVGAVSAGDGLLVSSDVVSQRPVASNVNFDLGFVDPNVAMAPIGTDGEVCFANGTRSPVDLVADHLGTLDRANFILPSASGAPVRVVDTRNGVLTEPPGVVRPECDLPTTTNYSTPVARVMLGLSLRAYDVEPGQASPGALLDDIGNETVQFATEMACWELVSAIRGSGAAGLLTDTEVIVARNVDTGDLAVAFRGTEANPLDWITDAGAARTFWALPDDRLVVNAVHSGFGAAYLAVRDDLLAVLSQNEVGDEDGTRVFFTGHSLGGALATLASLDLSLELQSDGYDRTEVVTYTFGAPRAMSLEMVNHHASFVPNSWAVASPNDPVPHVPSAIGTSNPYSHIHNVMVTHGIDGTRQVRRNSGDGRNYGGCAHLIPDFGDHARTEYVNRVDATIVYGPPRVWVESYNDPVPFGIDNLRMFWDSPIEGPCDQVAMYSRTTAPTSISGAIRDRWAILDTNDQHSTTVNVGDANWVAYVDMFGKVISSRNF